MNDKNTTTVRAVFSPSETDHMLRCVDQAITAYERSQKQRPEFSKVAQQYVDELTALKLKIKGLPN